MSPYEWRWLGISLAVLAVFLGLSIGFTMTHQGRLPMTPKIDPVKTILSDAMFQHPGVTRIGPNHYRAVIVARQFAFDPAKLEVPVGARVDFYITSADVVHGFELPDSDVNVEVFPGYVAHVHAKFRKTGRFLTVCNQYCGIGHQNMLGDFAVVTKAAYKKNLAAGVALASASAVPLAGVIMVIGPAAIADGKSVFASNCAGCHQATGKGVPGAFPPLAGTLTEYTISAPGRVVLAHILLDGLKGPIKAGAKAYNGVMPAWGTQLKDQQIADVVDYIATAWNNNKALPKSFKPFDPAEIARERTPALSASAVDAERTKLLAHH